MSWSRSRAEARIRRFMETTPIVAVERYEDEYLPRLEIIKRAAQLRGDYGQADAPPLFNLPNATAVLVDTVQVYVRALNYDDVRLDEGRETAQSHGRGMAFLHLLYSAGDRVVEEADCQRVDFHGARMHAVVIEPRGADRVGERIAAALSLAEQMMSLARSAGDELFPDQRFKLRFRVGIDVGPCIAINSGRQDEREPMFIGSSANHAAKLAAGDQEGVYLSDRARAALAFQRRGSLLEEASAPASSLELQSVREKRAQLVETASVTRRRLEDWRKELDLKKSTSLKPSDFSFHHHQPPLRSIVYDKLSPSNSIRMPLVSIFADLDKYTAYIDSCMASGRLGEAVRVLHVIRSEFNAVLQDDFNGRKVRFIGDCIHGIIADGNSRETDEQASVTLATKCTGALRSSFQLCLDMMPDAKSVGLAIGLELGPTPVSRIGIRGDRSVRVASSLAVRASEQCQSLIRGDQTMIGAAAYGAARAAVKKLFPSRIATDLTYDDVATQVDATGVAAKVAGSSALLATPVVAAAPARAYTRGE